MPKVIPFDWDTGRMPVFQLMIEQSLGDVCVRAQVWQYDSRSDQLYAPPPVLANFAVMTREYRESTLLISQFGYFVHWHACYYQPYEVELEQARLMLQTLTNLERGLQAYTKELGESGSFAQYLVRIARCLGIGHFVTKRSRNGTYNPLEITLVDNVLLNAVCGFYPETKRV